MLRKSQALSVRLNAILSGLAVAFGIALLLPPQAAAVKDRPVKQVVPAPVPQPNAGGPGVEVEEEHQVLGSPEEHAPEGNNSDDENVMIFELESGDSEEGSEEGSEERSEEGSKERSEEGSETCETAIKSTSFELLSAAGSLMNELSAGSANDDDAPIPGKPPGTGQSRRRSLI